MALRTIFFRETNLKRAGKRRKKTQNKRKINNKKKTHTHTLAESPISLDMSLGKSCIMHSRRVGFLNSVRLPALYLGLTNSTTTPSSSPFSTCYYVGFKKTNVQLVRFAPEFFMFFPTKARGSQLSSDILSPFRACCTYTLGFLGQVIVHSHTEAWSTITKQKKNRCLPISKPVLPRSLTATVVPVFVTVTVTATVVIALTVTTAVTVTVTVDIVAATASVTVTVTITWPLLLPLLPL